MHELWLDMCRTDHRGAGVATVMVVPEGFASGLGRGATTVKGTFTALWEPLAD